MESAEANQASRWERVRRSYVEGSLGFAALYGAAELYQSGHLANTILAAFFGAAGAFGVIKGVIDAGNEQMLQKPQQPVDSHPWSAVPFIETLVRKHETSPVTQIVTTDGCADRSMVDVEPHTRVNCGVLSCDLLYGHVTDAPCVRIDDDGSATTTNERYTGPVRMSGVCQETEDFWTGNTEA